MSSPPLTPAEKRRLKVREAILAAAERVFAREGEAGLSIRRLARKIDYSPAAIYKYFSSKDDLVDELKEAFFERLMAQVHKIADTSRPFPERMSECLATYVYEAIAKPYHYGAAYAGTAKDNGVEIGEPGYDDSIRGRAFLVLQGMVEEGISKGHFRDDLDPQLAAKSIWASMHGLAMMMIHIPTFPKLTGGCTELDRTAFINLHADQLVKGLEARA